LRRPANWKSFGTLLVPKSQEQNRAFLAFGPKNKCQLKAKLSAQGGQQLLSTPQQGKTINAAAGFKWSPKSDEINLHPKWQR